ncbi:MAG: TIGR04211 family SH3 domain-containing protein [Desulfobulbaceae bacterium]|nr:TIGR04211 family SH3 domain-containing protein [Desulfobulbaceae bacterium]
MRFFCIIFTLFIITSNVIVPPAEADTRYVGDQLIVTLRLGESTKHKILKTLKTGTPVEVLQEGETYMKVRTSDGTEGYVLRQYISSNPPKSQRIDKLEIEKNALQKKINELQNAKITLEKQLNGIQEKYKSEFSELTTKSSEIEQNFEKVSNSERLITEKYNTLVAQSENVVAIAQERDQLLQKNNKLTTGMKMLQEKNEKFADSRMIKWFLAGGGVFFFGWITGRISRKKRSRF